MKFYDCGELSSPGAWCPLSYDKQSRLAVALSRGSEIVLISDSDMSVLEVEIQSPGVLSNAGKAGICAFTHIFSDRSEADCSDL